MNITCCDQLIKLEINQNKNKYYVRLSGYGIVEKSLTNFEDAINWAKFAIKNNFLEVFNLDQPSDIKARLDPNSTIIITGYLGKQVTIAASEEAIISKMSEWAEQINFQ